MDWAMGIVGQERAIALLDAAWRRRRLAAAYLFVGAAGVGRRTTARAWVRLLLGLGLGDDLVGHPDLLWVEPTYLERGQLLTVAAAEAAGLKRRGAPQIRLEQVRQVAEFASRSPLQSQQVVVVVEQAETMAEAAANGLLKTLEESPQAVFILMAADGGAVLPTIVSRCQRVRFQRLSAEAIASLWAQMGRGTLGTELTEIAQGSMGATILAHGHMEQISESICQAIDSIPLDTTTALTLAKKVAADLDLELQQWLIQFWMQRIWRSPLPLSLRVAGVKDLERAYFCLEHYVQPRLVWEAMLLHLGQPAAP
ncbi:MAG: DNA polymerase III subunit delta' [Oscillatoriales cyanobacterium SM2_2_1]|nr:DNA polymerase III subunit delta' [Oscillatoriales cyanobacterium SM2_2_1]